jgi:D-aminoacyl-tRNA deacylase
MRILLQRISEASVSVDGVEISSVGRGYLLFLGVMEGDGMENAEALSEKIVKLRLFEGEDGKINDRSILDIGGEILVVSQFTLAGKLEKGNRPDYTKAAPPALAEALYRRFIELLREKGVQKVKEGRFGAHMKVALSNDGPVTLMIER